MSIPNSPGLYWAAYDPYSEPEVFNAIAVVTGAPPFLRFHLLFVGPMSFEAPPEFLARHSRPAAENVTFGPPVDRPPMSVNPAPGKSRPAPRRSPSRASRRRKS